MEIDMNYVKQAYALSASKKVLAKELYEQAVAKLVCKDYVLRIHDAHVDLSAIFGELWLLRNKNNGAFWNDWNLYAEANVAFNYANLSLGIKGKFFELARQIVADERRVEDIKLKKMTKQMDSILTATTVEKIRSKAGFR